MKKAVLTEKRLLGVVGTSRSVGFGFRSESE